MPEKGMFSGRGLCRSDCPGSGSFYRRADLAPGHRLRVISRPFSGAFVVAAFAAKAAGVPLAAITLT
jgi:hypothetical protein